MMRRACPAIVAAIVMSVVSLSALERATFVLINGERITGDVAFHTEARTNIREDTNEFNVKIASGVEMPIPFAQVVAIDFAGGTPQPDEIAALPLEGHLLTLRSGETRLGHLVDLIGGDTIRWRNTGGDEVNVPITDARRIFLRPDRAREVYNLPDAPDAAAHESAEPAPTAPSRVGTLPASSTGTTIAVRGALPWTDSGLTVRRGQAVRFEVTGEVFYTRTTGTGPAGAGAPNANASYPLPSLPVGALIAKIGPNGAPFAIGTATDALRMPATGRLMLGINDDDFDDNSGSFRVIVIR
jgi:hypothetical protein